MHIAEYHAGFQAAQHDAAEHKGVPRPGHDEWFYIGYRVGLHNYYKEHSNEQNRLVATPR